jgi:hypothetical protein
MQSAHRVAVAAIHCLDDRAVNMLTTMVPCSTGVLGRVLAFILYSAGAVHCAVLCSAVLCCAVRRRSLCHVMLQMTDT